MNVAETDELESDEDKGKDSEPSEGKSKWYIERNGTQIHGVKESFKDVGTKRVYFERKEPQTLGEWFPPHLSGTHQPIS